MKIKPSRFPGVRGEGRKTDQGETCMALYCKQLKAAYITEEIHKIIEKFPEKDREEIRELYKYDSCFEMVTNFKPGERGENSRELAICMVARNIVERGFPTLAPKLMRQEVHPGITADGIKRALVIYDKDYVFSDWKRYYYKTPGGELELVDDNEGEISLLMAADSFKAQHFERQKPLEHIISHPGTPMEQYKSYVRYCLSKSLDRLLKQYAGQRVDFAVMLPRLSPHRSSCVNIEVDGESHQDMDQRIRDAYRDRLMEELEWEPTIRVGAKDIRGKRGGDIPGEKGGAAGWQERLEGFFGRYRELAQLPDTCGKEIRIPLFGARLTETLLYLTERNEIPLFTKKTVYIRAKANSCPEAVVLGLQHGLDILHHLAAIYGGTMVVGRILLKLDDMVNGRTEQYVLEGGKAPEVSEQRFGKTDLNLVEDMEHRLFAHGGELLRSKTVALYSSYSESEDHFLNVLSQSVPYQAEKKSKDSLKYFLQLIFRKESFRPQQFEIIQAALKKKNVIGILPTGSGKTITFQLPAMLQPQSSMIITPLISLMYDQIRNLKDIRVDSCAMVNSSVQGIERHVIQERIRKMGYQLIYISPERLQTDTFKDMLPCPMAQVVLDEAHCVSQWGHDFRTAYLRVGDTINKYFPEERKSVMARPILMALTGTASCNVVTDIKRELKMGRKVEVVMPTDFRREELHFRIFRLPEERRLSWRIKEGYVEKGLEEGIRLLHGLWEEESHKDFFRKERGRYVNGSLVFCPYSQRQYESVEAIHDRLTAVMEDDGQEMRDAARRRHEEPPEIEHFTFDKYHGSRTVEEKERAQNRFKENEIALLIATKAFGMGIDKPNVRLTLHTCIPESIEAFYQEAGRAGRDRQPAVNLVLAPPAETAFDSIWDKGISDYFISRTFPEKKEFMNTVKIFLHAEYLEEDDLADRLLKSIFDDDVSDLRQGLVFDTDPVRNRLTLTMKARVFGKSRSYDISLEGEKMAMKPLSAQAKKVYGPLDAECLALLQKNLREALRQEDIVLTPEDLPKAFAYKEKYASRSLLSIMKEVQESGVPRFCYVGLDPQDLLNPVDRILASLMKYREDGRLRVTTIGRFEGIKTLPQEVLRTMMEYAKITAEEAERIIPGFRLSQAEQIRACVATVKEARREWQREWELVRKGELRDYYEKCLWGFYPTYWSLCQTNQLEEYASGGSYWHLMKLCDVRQQTLDSGQEKILYYMGILGIYDDYTRYYGPDYAEIRVVPFSKETLKEHIREYISGYETADYLKRKISDLAFLDEYADDDVEGLVTAGLEYILDYSYEKIRTHRQKQMEVMYHCVEADCGGKKGEEAFSEEVYKYFESKYTDDIFKDIKNENLLLPMAWIDKVRKLSEAPEENILENLSHLRTSASKVQEQRPRSFTVYFLYAYGILGDPEMSIRDGIEAYLEGVERLQDVRANYRSELQRISRACLEDKELYYLEEVADILENKFGAERGKKVAENLKEFKAVARELLKEAREKAGVEEPAGKTENE